MADFIPDFIPILAQQSRLSEIPIVDGQLIHVFDAGIVYVDYSGHRYKMFGGSSGKGLDIAIVSLSIVTLPGNWYICTKPIKLTLPAVHLQTSLVKVSTVINVDGVSIIPAVGLFILSDSSFLLDLDVAAVLFIWDTDRWKIALLTARSADCTPTDCSSSAEQNGMSAYQIAVANGYVGTLQLWLNSLKGKDGSDGLDGASAYQLAVQNGYSGTQASWLASLKGQDGTSAYQIAVQHGYSDSLSSWLTSLKGSAGMSAYQIAVANGYVGTLQQWLASLSGQGGSGEGSTTQQANVGIIACLCTQQPLPIFDGMIWVYGGTALPRYYSVVGGLYCIALEGAGTNLPNGTILIK